MAKQTIRISGEISDYTAWRIDQFLADNKGKAVVVRLASSAAMWLLRCACRMRLQSMATSRSFMTLSMLQPRRGFLVLRLLKCTLIACSTFTAVPRTCSFGSR